MKAEIKLENLNKKEALRYMGYGNNEADEKVLAILDECEQEIIKCAKPRYVYRKFDIEFKDNSGDADACDFLDNQNVCSHNPIRICGANIELPGNSIKRHLKGCKSVVFMAVTISEDIDRILRIAKVNDMVKAVVMDSLASVAVEQACDKTEQIIKEDFPGLYQTFRFGVGYGDLPIELQKDFLNVLNAQKLIGLNVTQSCVLVPTKSVTAIIGLSENEIKGQARGCQTCNMSKRCRFRKEGGHCFE